MEYFPEINQGAEVHTDSLFSPGNIIVDNNTPQNAYNGSTAYVDKWFMMESPFPVVSLAVIYLVFVLKIGPNYMSNKSAFSLKPLILLYNFVQVIFSTWWAYSMLEIIFQSKSFHLWQNMCWPHTLHPKDAFNINTLAWWYLMSKYVELLDTVFFVLRKKQNQVTFLHVYHHTNMAVSTWVFIKYVKNIQTLPLGLFNTMVHILMYGYYLLAALGPKVAKYLWWKKYITTIQISQFVIILAYLLCLYAYGCPIQNTYIIYAFINTLTFLLLFYNFYTSSYKKVTTRPKVSTSAVNTNGCKNALETLANNNNVAPNNKKHM